MNEIINKGTGDTYDVSEYGEVDEEIQAGLNNAKLLYKPEFIPFYLKEVKDYDFSNTEGLVYGFIRFYLSSNPKGQFYFTNEQLAYMFDVSTTTISLSVKKILECGEFRAIYKVKANGGTFRLLENLKSDYKKTESLALRKLKANKNKIKENKINRYNNFLEQKQDTSWKEKEIEKTKQLLKKNK